MPLQICRQWFERSKLISPRIKSPKTILSNATIVRPRRDRANISPAIHGLSEGSVFPGVETKDRLPAEEKSKLDVGFDATRHTPVQFTPDHGSIIGFGKDSEALGILIASQFRNEGCGIRWISSSTPPNLDLKNRYLEDNNLQLGQLIDSIGHPVSRELLRSFARGEPEGSKQALEFIFDLDQSNFSEILEADKNASEKTTIQRLDEQGENSKKLGSISVSAREVYFIDRWISRLKKAFSYEVVINPRESSQYIRKKETESDTLRSLFLLIRYFISIGEEEIIKSYSRSGKYSDLASWNGSPLFFYISDPCPVMYKLICKICSQAKNHEQRVCVFIVFGDYPSLSINTHIQADALVCSESFFSNCSPLQLGALGITHDSPLEAQESGFTSCFWRSGVEPWIGLKVPEVPIFN